jgi:glycosyltransferase involved in cell wall biosynthesis
VTNAPAASVLIATYNRARLLGETLSSLARMRVSPSLRWEAVVVDNNSSDGTRRVVEEQANGFPVPLRYVFERQQGRSSALNAGIEKAAGAVLAFTDDDVLLNDGWLDAACAALTGTDLSIGYAGGPIRPIWEVAPPRWFDLSRGDLWGTIAIQDHGAEPFVYEEGGKVPLGANMAVRRSVFAAAGGFRADLGRTEGRLLLGQEVPEFLIRARQAGFRGLYVPAMQLRHHVPARRLTRSYFRKWWFGKGVSRAALDRMQPVGESGIDLSRAPHFLRVPRTLYGSALRHTLDCVREHLAGRTPDAFRHEMLVAYFAGYFWSRQRERRADPASARRPRATASRTSSAPAGDPTA